MPLQIYTVVVEYPQGVVAIVRSFTNNELAMKHIMDLLGQCDGLDYRGMPGVVVQQMVIDKVVENVLADETLISKYDGQEVGDHLREMVANGKGWDAFRSTLDDDSMIYDAYTDVDLGVYPRWSIRKNLLYSEEGVKADATDGYDDWSPEA